MEVRVDGVRWEETPRMFDQGPHSEGYLVRLEDDGKTRVVFGDGEHGARLPSGAENVVATYRSGIGFAGMVAAGSLTLLQTRPLGIRGVTNPLPAADAAEPENRDSARANAPLTVLTLDRIVSLADFEDFARAFSGIGKAQATTFWRGERRYVHVTIAAASGTPVIATSPLFTNLQSAIAAASDPGVIFAIDTYQPLYFNLSAKVLIAPRYEWSAIQANIEAALLAAFAFGQRAFGQPVTAAEVVTVIQRISGVVATDLDSLYLVTNAPATNTALATRLLAQPARWNTESATIERAQLLLINPAGVILQEMSA
jgi:predicted phage baseplate assembly protein